MGIENQRFTENLGDRKLTSWTSLKDETNGKRGIEGYELR